jgi:ribosomal protein L3 glutamine methyltransferase
MTLIALIEASAARLSEAGVCFGHGTTNARDEAAWLVLWRLGLPLDTELEGPQSQELRPVSATELEQCATLIEARIESRKPAAYLTREAWLQGVSFYVDERVIVPRSLIAELLVEGSLDYWLRADTHTLLDLCTGNGSLAVIAALVYPDTTVDAADISSDALAVAAINVERHHLNDRVRLLQSDGLTDLPQRYDLILCNPPYVNAESMAALPPEYLAEPAIALDGNRSGGSDGMDFVRTLLTDAPRAMNPGAVLVLEIGNERTFFETAFPTLQAIWLDTSAGEDQVLLLTRDALTA